MNSVKFGEYHAYNDLNLILNSKEIGSAEIKKNLIEVQGADGFLDLTDFFAVSHYMKTDHLLSILQ